MKINTLARSASVAAAALAIVAVVGEGMQRAHAAEIRILSAAAMQSIFKLIAGVIEKLGISEQMKPKTKFGAGGDVTEVTLAQGGGTLGMTQVSEIVNKVGAEFVGPFPNELQNYTGITLGIPTEARPSRAVR